MCDALHYLVDKIFIKFGSKLYIKSVGIQMGTYCAPLVAIFCNYITSGCLFLTINQVGVLKHLSLPQNI